MTVSVKHVCVWEALPQKVSKEAARVPISVRIRAGTRRQALLGKYRGPLQGSTFSPGLKVLSSSILQAIWVQEADASRGNPTDWEESKGRGKAGSLAGVRVLLATPSSLFFKVTLSAHVLK